MKAQLILVVSNKMDTNKKAGRRENKLIRIGEKARANLGLTNDKTVELWPNSSTKERIARSTVLTIFRAFSSDIKKLREQGMSQEDILRVGFVTTNTFNHLCTNNDATNIWITDSTNEIIIGGDPEFILINNDEAVYAGKVDGLYHNGRFGSDGPLAELRPDPESSVDIFVNNIYNLLSNTTITKCIQDFKWAGGCFYRMRRVGREKQQDWPIGGHIHIGTPMLIVDKMIKNETFRMKIHSVIQRILDSFVAVPMMKVEGVDVSCSRRRHYGQYGARRTTGVGNNRLEYRTLSGQWLTHPKMAKAVLETVQAIVHAIFKDVEDHDMDSAFISDDNVDIYMYFSNDTNPWENIELTRKYGVIESNAEMRAILEHGDITFSTQYINKIKNKLRSLTTYETHKNNIDVFCDIISQSKRDLAKQETDLKKTWLEGKNLII